MGDVVGEGFLVEDAGAPHHCPKLPGCEGAAKSRDGGVGLAETDTLLQVNTYKLKFHVLSRTMKRAFFTTLYSSRLHQMIFSSKLSNIGYWKKLKSTPLLRLKVILNEK